MKKLFFYLSAWLNAASIFLAGFGVGAGDFKFLLASLFLSLAVQVAWWAAGKEAAS